jgi:hypothetical protein
MEDTANRTDEETRSALHEKFAISFLHLMAKRPIRVEAEHSTPIDADGWTRILFPLHGDVASYVSQLSVDGRETTIYLLRDDLIVNKFAWPPTGLKNLGQELSRMPVIARLEIESIAIWARFNTSAGDLVETRLDH